MWLPHGAVMFRDPFRVVATWCSHVEGPVACGCHLVQSCSGIRSVWLPLGAVMFRDPFRVVATWCSHVQGSVHFINIITADGLNMGTYPKGPHVT